LKKSIVLLSLAVALVCAASATAAIRFVTVTPSNFNSIFTRGDSRPISSYRLVTGPATPPIPRGSLELTTEDSAGKQQHLETQQQGTPIASISRMGYASYRHAESTGSPVQVAGLNLEVVGANTGTATGYATFVYEPVYNGTVVPGRWQLWDAYRGGSAVWWSTRDILDATGAPVVCNPNGALATTSLCVGRVYVPWSVLVAANPNAVVLSYGVNQGTGAPGIISNVDGLLIGTAADTWIYNFEPGRMHGGGGGDDD
jgi:hypothetical protein